MNNPRILITNDDGIDAPGIKILQEIAKEISNDVWVVAPSDNQSGAGHRFTLGKELFLETKEENIYAINSGTPADCIAIACTHILKEKKPDIVLSGVNHGQNLGDIIHCSGTMAGAREGALHGALGIGLSQALDYEKSHKINWDNTKKYALKIVKSIIKEHDGSDIYYNVNFPIDKKNQTPNVCIVPHQRFHNSPFAHYPSKNEGKFFVAIPSSPTPLDAGYDYIALQNEYKIAITPLLLQQTDFEAAKNLEGKISL